MYVGGQNSVLPPTFVLKKLRFCFKVTDHCFSCFLEEVRFLNDEADDTEQEQRIVVLADDSGPERKRKKSGSGKRRM